MLRGVAPGARTAERPRQQAYLVHMAQRADVVHYAVDVAQSDAIVVSACG
jgi:hypothetical protein